MQCQDTCQLTDMFSQHHPTAVCSTAQDHNAVEQIAEAKNKPSLSVKTSPCKLSISRQKDKISV